MYAKSWTAAFRTGWPAPILSPRHRGTWLRGRGGRRRRQLAGCALVQAEADAETDGAARFRPLLVPLKLALAGRRKEDHYRATQPTATSTGNVRSGLRSIKTRAVAANLCRTSAELATATAATEPPKSTRSQLS